MTPEGLRLQPFTCGLRPDSLGRTGPLQTGTAARTHSKRVHRCCFHTQTNQATKAADTRRWPTRTTSPPFWTVRVGCRLHICNHTMLQQC